MKVLQVIHGYPMRYNAGSEVYTQSLCRGLADRHEVHVFTREEDPFAADFAVRWELDAGDPRITLHVVNNPRSRDRYRQAGIDTAFANLLDNLRPDIVHIGHLNHLSTSLVSEAAEREIPVVYTLHDYWVMCPRGQFMQMHSEDLWAACDGQEDTKCAERCYARYFSGAPDEHEIDVSYWADWVRRRMSHIRQMAERVDVFIAPARYLEQRYRNDFGLNPGKLLYLDYGFPLERLAGRRREEGEPFTFGYIGTHIPAKGIQHLVEAFGRVEGDSRLCIWGRPRGQETEALKALALDLPNGGAARIEWRLEYCNDDIVADVFNHVDCIVVPSIWVENSPLVIHEALQARVPVITADAGGMAEYVHHEINGLLFEHRSVSSLATQMQRLANDPALARRLGQRGYVQSENGNVPDLDGHVRRVEEIYAEAIRRRDSARIKHLPGPWRITFDTNPDACNLRCLMCEEHSPFADGRRPANDKRLMPIDTLRRVVAEAAPLGLREIIPSTMGEPLLYEHFDDIIDLCHQHGLKLNLTTNGTFPRRGAEAWAERIIPVGSDVKISWNGATGRTHEAIMRGTRWETVLDNVERFIGVRNRHAAATGHRCRVTFQVTFLDDNVAELPDIVRLAAKLGVDRVKGHHLWVHSPEMAGQSMRRSNDVIERWNAIVAETRKAAGEQERRVQLDNIFPLEPDATTDLAPGGRCPFLGQEAWVSAVGRFDPCCAPDQLRRTLGNFGSLQAESIQQIWSSSAYRTLVKTYRNRDLCRECNMRQPAEVVS